MYNTPPFVFLLLISRYPSEAAAGFPNDEQIPKTLAKYIQAYNTPTNIFMPRELCEMVWLRCGVMRQMYSLSPVIATARIIFLCFDDFGNKNGTKIDMNIGYTVCELKMVRLYPLVNISWECIGYFGHHLNEILQSFIGRH